jgi:hydroxymethylpyrimidine/phosphomethylpyrimidine kinase
LRVVGNPSSPKSSARNRTFGDGNGAKSPDPDFLYAALDATACAAFIKESRMNFAEANNSTGNPGEGSNIHLQVCDFQSLSKKKGTTPCTESSMDRPRIESRTTAGIPSVPVALTIAGFDPSSGAGITADLKTFSAHGIYGVACITAMTVQSTLGVRAVEPLPGKLARETLECLAEDTSIAGIKIGMLGSSSVVGEVSSFLTAHSGTIPRGRVVLDPVLRSSSGTPLLDQDGLGVLREELLGRVAWITPNLDELALLTGGDLSGPGGFGLEQVPAAAARLQTMAVRLGNDELNVVVTGGHLDRPDDFLLTASGEQSWLAGERIVTNATHGTGCAFSSALLCGLISGRSPQEAVAAAKAYVTEALRLAYPVGKGKGPMNHLFSFHPA